MVGGGRRGSPFAPIAGAGSLTPEDQRWLSTWPVVGLLSARRRSQSMALPVERMPTSTAHPPSSALPQAWGRQLKVLSPRLLAVRTAPLRWSMWPVRQLMHPRVSRVAPNTTHPSLHRVSIVASDGTEITGFSRHGIKRVIGDGGAWAGVRPEAVLDALRNPLRTTPGVDQLGRPFRVYTGANARVVINPDIGRVVSVNSLSGAGAHR